MKVDGEEEKGDGDKFEVKKGDKKGKVKERR